MAETDKFAVDAAIFPRRVIGRHLDRKPTHRFGGGWTPWWSVRLGPVPRYSAAMPTQQRLGSHQPASIPRTWEGLSDRAKQAPVIVAQLRAVYLSIQHAQLVAQRDDLEILRAARTNSQACHRRKETVQDTKHEASLIGQHRAWSTQTAEFRARTGQELRRPGWSWLCIDPL